MAKRCFAFVYLHTRARAAKRWVVELVLLCACCTYVPMPRMRPADVASPSLQCDAKVTKANKYLTSTAQYVSVLVVDVLMDHVDLTHAPAQQRLGFAGSLATKARARQDGKRPYEPTNAAFIAAAGKKVLVGTIETPYLNVVSCALIGAVGVLLFIGASFMPSFDALSVVLSGYAEIMPQYEEERAQLLQSRPSKIARALSLVSFPSSLSRKQSTAGNSLGREQSSGDGAHVRLAAA